MVSVGILSTKILTLDERLVVIPNNTLISSSITNFARGGGDGMARRLYLTLDVGVDYDEDPAHVKGVLLEVLEKSPFVLDDPAPRVHLWELADSSVIFRLFGYLGDYAASNWPGTTYSKRSTTDSASRAYQSHSQRASN